MLSYSVFILIIVILYLLSYGPIGGINIGTENTGPVYIGIVNIGYV